MPDPLMTRLSRLPEAAPRPTRAERTRQRCHAELRRQAARNRRRRPFALAVVAAAWRPAVALLGAAYLAGTILLAFEVYGRH